MGLLDAYQDSTDTTLRVMASQPLEAEKPKGKHSAWSAIPRGVAAAAVEVGGNVIDAGTAIGQAAAAATNENARKMLMEEGFDLRTEASQVQYNYARDLRPDPMTAGVAENLVFGLTKGLTKAVPAALTMGPLAGAAAFGGSEGLTAADDLAAQGVDKATRTKVGLVTGAVNAAGVALPVAGNTLAKTAGLVAVGGPASFITQQLATREILKDADYHAIAQQYDPLDPVGLAVATLVPAGFATAAMRGARTGARPLPDATPVRVADDAAVTPETVPAGSQDAIDAAMVHNLTTIRDVHEAVSAEIAARPEIDVPTEKQIWQMTSKEFLQQNSGKKVDLVDNKNRSGTLVYNHRQEVATAIQLGKDVPQNVLDEFKVYSPDLARQFETNITRIEEKKSAASNKGITPDAYRARVEQLKTEQPDLVARIGDDGQPVRLADELDAIRKQAQEGTDTEFGALDAPLLKIAAECALATGTAGL